MSNDQCAIGPDGKLLDAKYIEFRHDPDDPNPLPPVSSDNEAGSLPVSREGRGCRVKSTSRLDQVLLEEKLDEDGLLISKASNRRPRQSRQARQARPSSTNVDAVISVDTDPEDNDFSGTDSGDSHGSGLDENEELIVGNDELADILPSKTIASNSKRASQQCEKGNQKKRKATSAPEKTAKKVCAPSDKQAATQANVVVPSNPVDRQDLVSSVMAKKKNFIYLFFEDVKVDSDGTSTPDCKYYKCYHGARRTFKVTKAMKHNLKHMVSHIESKFPSMNQLLNSFNNRDTPPTPFELQIAAGSPNITEDEINRHLKSLQLEKVSTIQSAFDKQTMAAWDQNEFETLLAEWMVSCDQPFDEVDHPLFKKLLNYVHSPSRKQLKIPGQTTIRKRIMKMGQDSIESTKKMFSELESKMAASLDAWTSPNQHAFLAMIVHFVNNDGVLEELLIDFRELIGEHSGENMADVVWETFKLYGITDKIVAFVMDNATNNDTMLKSFEKRCKNDGIDFSARDARGRCMPHTIHLVVLKLLETAGAISANDAQLSASRAVNYQDIASSSSSDDGDDILLQNATEDYDAIPERPNLVDMLAIGRLRKIVRAVRASPQRRKLWLQTVQLTHPSNNPDGTPHTALMLILDVRTRWSSTHAMLQRAILYERSIKHFAAANHEYLRDYYLAEDDWKNIKLLASWLEIFRSASTQMSSTSIPMISTTHAIFRGLQDKLRSILREMPNDIAPSIKSGLVEAHRKLSDYFTKFDESPYYTWAAILDPRITYEELKQDYEDDATLLQGLEESKRKLSSHFNKYYASGWTDPSGAASTSPNTPGSSTFEIPSTPPAFDFTARFRRVKSHQVLNELEEYLRLPPQEFYSCDPIKWWYSQRYRFPRL